MRSGLTETAFPFLARLGAAARRELGVFPPVRVKPKQRLLRRGQPVRGIYLVIAGSLRVYYVSAAGREATLYRVEPGGTCVLALSASFDEAPYPAWVDAGSEGGSYVQVPSETCRRLLGAESGFRDFVFGTLSGRIFELMQTLEETGSTQVQQRLARYIARRGKTDGVVRATQAGIASDLGTAREVVSRALRALAARGLVKTGRMRVEVVDHTALQAFAELRE